MKSAPLHYTLIAVLALALYACSTESASVADASATGPKSLPAQIDYNLHIKPILSDKCFACHGPDKATQKADFALHTADRAYAELAKDPGLFGIIPGNVDESQVISRILSHDQGAIMPPPESNLTLSQYEKDLIIAWVKQGAVYKTHWSLIPVEKPEIPEVKAKDWVQTPVDNFILAKLEDRGWQPEARASKEKLIRRLYLDLTGLPPSLEEIDAFLQDESEDAYEKQVDKLLNSVEYAERMAFRWLDIARYADSHGYQDDHYRSMWPWREWVINAYHENKPFKQFLTEQLAGDLLPDATYDQILATGFNRNHSLNQEGGIIFEEFRAEYVADRTNTFGQAVLGLTMECAKCHDHKYDPISQKEYFQLFSFFNQLEEGQYGEAPKPALEYPEEKLDELRAYIQGLSEDYLTRLETRQEEVYADIEQNQAFKTWRAAQTPNSELAHADLKPVLHESFDLHPKVQFPFETSDTLTPLSYPKAGTFGRALFLEKDELEIHEGDFMANDKPFSVSLWFYNHHYSTRKHLITKLDAKDRGFALRYNTGGTIWITIHDGNLQNPAIKLVSTNTIKQAQWVHIALSYDGSGNTNGFKLYLDGKHNPLEWDIDKEIPNISNDAPLMIGAFVPPRWKGDASAGKGFFGSGMDELFMFDRVISEQEVQTLRTDQPAAELLAVPFEELAQTQKQRLIDEYLFNHDRDFSIALRNYFASVFKKLDVPEKGTLNTMVMGAPEKYIPTYVLERGVYNAHGEEVKHGTPEAVMDFGKSFQQDRLGLAQWLFDEKNPLTSRVAVNRYWEYLFGRGLVKTVDDFGNQGAMPSHPELLDWMSATFMEKGWDIKAMMKMMVMSATYQQNSSTSAKKRMRDPENIYLAYSPRYRLPVEMIRDQALAASGLLNKKVGGPSVRPYQPGGLWAQTSGGGGGPLQRYVMDVTEDLYRRSLYTFWKRTVPPPTMLTFDAPTRDRCIVSRQSTNTPLQALTLLNSPIFMEAARVLAQQTLKEGKSESDNIKTAYRKLTGRYPSKKDLKRLKALYAESLDTYKEEYKAAQALISIGEYPIDESLDTAVLAAHTLTFSAILNLDETITKE